MSFFLRPENFCFPFRVQKKPVVGRVLVATRNIQPLELILWDDAAAMGPRMGGTAVCLQCLKVSTLEYLCSSCNWPVCGKKCEMGSIHKKECEILKNSTIKVKFESQEEIINNFRCITPLRMLLSCRQNKEILERCSYLMDHNNERKKDFSLWNLHQTTINRFIKSCNINADDNEIDRVVGLLWTNSFACAQGGGQAIFPTFSFASHSCKPNCAQTVFPNKTLALQAKVEIEVGEELKISYISTIQGFLKREEKLEKKWFFKCLCERCIDPTECNSHASSLKCKSCLSGTLIFSKNSLWKCTQCNHEKSDKDVLEIETRITKELQSIDKNDLKNFETFLSKARSDLYENHYLMILLKRHMIGLYSLNLPNLDLDTLEKVKKYAEDVNFFYESNDPGYHKDRGTILRALSEIKKLLCKKKMCQKIINEQEFKIEVNEAVKIFQEAQKCMFVRVRKI